MVIKTAKILSNECLFYYPGQKQNVMYGTYYQSCPLFIKERAFIGISGLMQRRLTGPAILKGYANCAIWKNNT